MPILCEHYLVPVHETLTQRMESYEISDLRISVPAGSSLPFESLAPAAVRCTFPLDECSDDRVHIVKETLSDVLCIFKVSIFYRISSG